MKAQVSTELLVVLGLIIVLFIAIFSVVYYKLLISKKELDILQATLSLSNLASSIDAVSTSEALVVDLSFPNDVESFTAKDHSLKIIIRGKGDVVRFTRTKITNNLPKGSIPTRVVLKKEEDGSVSINLPK